MTWDPGAYGRHFAEVYDDWYPDRGESADVVSLLTGLAGGPGEVVELGVGTGRLAIPLALAGWRVHGVDAAAEMLEILARRCAAAGVSVHGWLADASSFAPVEHTADVVLAACNFVFNLPDTATLERTLSQARRALAPGGLIVLDAVVPDPRPAPGSRIDPGQVPGVTIETTVSLDERGAIVRGTHRGPGTRDRRWQIRLVHPTELDEITERLGLRLRHRWENWQHGTYRPGASTRHVSVYAS